MITITKHLKETTRVRSDSGIGLLEPQRRYSLDLIVV